jgi:hypothetical protein
MKRFFVVLAALLLFPAPLYCVSLENEYLRVNVDDDSGRVFLSAAELEGGPDGTKWRALLFYDRPPSSFTAVAVASWPAMFGSAEGRFTSRPHQEGDEILCEWETDGVRTTQAVTFIERRGSDRRDGILIRYVMRNTSGREIPAGVCVVFDTVLSEKSPAHFLLSDGRSVSGPLELSGSDVPDFWSTDGGGICLMGVLKGSSATTPDRTLFANYRFIRERLFPSPLEPKAARTEGFSHGAFSRDDSAVALVFAPNALAEEREYRIVVGLCGDGEFGPHEPVREMFTPAPLTETHAAAAERPGHAPEPIPAPPPPAALRPETGAAEAPPGSAFRGKEMEAIERIDELIEEIDRRLMDEHSRDARRGSGQPGKLPEPIDEEEINRLNERLKEIEKTAEEGK